MGLLGFEFFYRGELVEKRTQPVVEGLAVTLYMYFILCSLNFLSVCPVNLLESFQASEKKHTLNFASRLLITSYIFCSILILFISKASNITGAM